MALRGGKALTLWPSFQGMLGLLDYPPVQLLQPCCLHQRQPFAFPAAEAVTNSLGIFKHMRLCENVSLDPRRLVICFYTCILCYI